MRCSVLQLSPNSADGSDLSLHTCRPPVSLGRNDVFGSYRGGFEPEGPAWGLGGAGGWDWSTGWLASCMRIWAMVEEGPRSGFWEALLTPYAVSSGLLGRPHDGAFTQQCLGHSTGDGVSAQARWLGGGGVFRSAARGDERDGFDQPGTAGSEDDRYFPKP